MDVNDHDLKNGPHDGGKVTSGSNVCDMPDHVWLQRKPNEDGYQPWARAPSKNFPAGYGRSPGSWGVYYFLGWAKT